MVEDLEEAVVVMMESNNPSQVGRVRTLHIRNVVMQYQGVFSFNFHI